MDCSAVMHRFSSTACADSRSPARPYAQRQPHSEFIITNGMPASRDSRLFSPPFPDCKHWSKVLVGIVGWGTSISS